MLQNYYPFKNNINKRKKEHKKTSKQIVWMPGSAATRVLSVRLRFNRDSIRIEIIRQSRIAAYVMSRDSCYLFRSVTCERLYDNLR